MLLVLRIDTIKYGSLILTCAFPIATNGNLLYLVVEFIQSIVPLKSG